MLTFPATDGIEVYASDSGFICFKRVADFRSQDDEIVCLTIGQFRSVIKNADKLIANAEANKALERAGNND